MGESYEKILAVLDEFIEKHAEKLISDPVKRAILQRDLWTMFDWAALHREKMEFRGNPVTFSQEQIDALTSRLAKIIRCLALTKEQILALPDNYAAAVASKDFSSTFDPENPPASFLPANLFQPDGPWVCVGPAPVHNSEFGERSVFLVFISLPGGREETLAYLKTLNNFPEPWIYDSSRIEKFGALVMNQVMTHSFDPKRGPWVNPDTPQFPAGTKFALVRRALFIDDAGNIVASPMTLSLQLRVYQSVDFQQRGSGGQSIFEFKLQRKNLFAGKSGGFHAVASEEKDFNMFLVPGIDLFEIKPPSYSLQEYTMSCMSCHDSPGIFSVISRSQRFSVRQTLRPPMLEESSPEHISNYMIWSKEDRYDWGLLKGLWRQKE